MAINKVRSPRVQRFVLPPLPDALKKRLDPELKCIVRMFQSTILSMPADVLGKSENPIREVFIDRHVQRWMAKAPKCLTYPSVKFLLNEGFSKMGIIIPPGQDFTSVFGQIVSDGLTKGLNAVLLEVEQSTLAVSDDFLRGLGLSDDSVEIFRGLLPSYSGTLDELLEASASV